MCSLIILGCICASWFLLVEATIFGVTVENEIYKETLIGKVKDEMRKRM
jgi:hypothetical protein